MKPAVLLTNSISIQGWNMQYQNTTGKNNKLRLGVALGSGSNRGWSHIGVLQGLSKLGIEPDIVCGCSVGALVGASYVAGTMHKLEQWLCSLTKLDAVRILEFKRSLNGIINVEKFKALLVEHVCDETLLIEDLDKTYAAVSTELETGREVWFTKGNMIDAVLASVSLPGLFPPVLHQQRWLVDGGLVNPVPVSMCRALGADIVIAVNLNAGIVGKRTKKPDVRNEISTPPTNTENNGVINSLSKSIMDYSRSLFPDTEDNQNISPGLFDAIAGSVNIMQDRITRSRMAGDPPDIYLVPKISHIKLLEFYRATETIEAGKQCVLRHAHEITELMGNNNCDNQVSISD